MATVETVQGDFLQEQFLSIRFNSDFLFAATTDLNASKDVREIGDLAVWSVTSAKPGNGVELLRDGRDDTYWQSDGIQPHLVNIQFQRKVSIAALAIHTDFKHDESYTPNKISIRVGSAFTDLREVKVVELHEPQGWLLVDLAVEKPLKGYILQLAVVSNHQNGRDTHIRQVKIFGPREDSLKIVLGSKIGFCSEEFLQYATCR